MILPDAVLEKLKDDFAFEYQARVDDTHSAVRICILTTKEKKFGRRFKRGIITIERRESMQQKKRILLLATGGTIASRKSDNGLKPQITPEELIEYSAGKRDLRCRGGSAFKSGQHQHGAVTLETHGSCDLGALRRF